MFPGVTDRGKTLKNFSNTICIGNDTTALADNQIILGNTLQTVYVQNAIQVVSDERKKYEKEGFFN